MKDYSLPEHDLDKLIVKDAIRAIGTVQKEKDVKSHICGGLAVSNYLPIPFRRSTIDLDFTFFWGGSSGEFREIMTPFTDYLSAKNCDLSVKRTGKTYDIHIKSPCDSLLVQHQRRTRKNFEDNRKSFEREFANDRLFFKDNLSYAVLSPEDIVAHKMSRILIFSERFEVEFPHSFKRKHIAQIAQHLREGISTLGVNADPSDVAQLRIYHDIYDIKALAEFAGLNKPYLTEALKDWEKGKVTRRNMEMLLDDMGVMLS